MDPLTFHIVFVPGTARYLQFGCQSLLEHGESDYVLAANGLPPDEVRLLASLAEREPRIRFVDLGADEPLKHGRALNRLVEQSDGPHFAFMDSDIFGLGEFEEELRGADIVTSCLPLFLEPDEAPPGFMGRNLETPSGALVGTSYLAVYRREVLDTVRDRWAIGFENYGPGQIPRPIRPLLAKYGWVRHRLDTGKLLNLLALEEGFTIRHAPTDGLGHVGGISRHFLGGGAEPGGDPFVLDDEAAAGADAPVGSGTLDEPMKRLLRRRREGIARYFAELLMSATGEAPRPVLRLSEGPLRARVKALEAGLTPVLDQIRTT